MKCARLALNTPIVIGQTGFPVVRSGIELCDALLDREEKSRALRMEKLFEGLQVFQGGAIQDYNSFSDAMIMRDFVHFSLYHKKFGYHPKRFRKYREEMTTGYFDPIPFGSLRNRADYEKYLGKIDNSTPGFITPTQLFQPFYGWVLAEYMIVVMKAKFAPHEPLVIYDVGAGSAAFAVSLLDFLAEQYPDVYERCEYHLLDINAYVIPIQRKKLVHHIHHVKLHHISIHNWRNIETRRCFVVCLEVISQMPHDCIVWTSEGCTHEMWIQFADSQNLLSATERYVPCHDPLILRYLRALNWLQEESFHALKMFCRTDGKEVIDEARPGWERLEPQLGNSFFTTFTKRINMINPFRQAFIPTGQLILLENLARFFPRHHVIVGDWSEVTQPFGGLNGPLVQAKVRVARDMYLRRATSDYLLSAGTCDWCFPTNFEHFATVYKSICGEHKEILSMQHPQFWRIFGGEKTAVYATQNGWNPLLEDFTRFTIFASNHPGER